MITYLTLLGLAILIRHRESWHAHRIWIPRHVEVQFLKTFIVADKKVWSTSLAVRVQIYLSFD